jgi:hypothetical protein
MRNTFIEESEYRGKSCHVSEVLSSDKMCVEVSEQTEVAEEEEGRSE